MPYRAAVAALALSALVVLAVWRAVDDRRDGAGALVPEATSGSPELDSRADGASPLVPSQRGDEGPPRAPRTEVAGVERLVAEAPVIPPALAPAPESVPRTRRLALEVSGLRDPDAAAARVVMRVEHGGTPAWLPKPWTPRREGRLLVVDFPAKHAEFAPLTLRLELEGGTYASGWIDLGRLGDERDVLVVPVEPVCDVSIEVRVGHTYPMEGVDIRLTPSPTLTAMTSYGARLCSIVWRPQGDGSGPIKGVPAGVHALDVSELRSVPRRLEVAAAPPGTTQVLVILDPLPLLGDLAGLITYEAPLQGHGGVRIQNVSDPRLSYSVGAGDRWEVRGVPAGTYDVVAFPGASFQVDPPSYRVSQASKSLDFTLRNGAPSVPVGFAIVDAATNLPLDGVWVHFVRANGVVRKVSLDHALRHESLPKNSTVRWRLVRDGYHPVEGTVADFDRVEPRPIDLELERRTRGSAVDSRFLPVVDVWVADVSLRRLE